MSGPTCECGKPTGGEWLCVDCQITFKWALVNVAAYYPDLGTIARKQARYNTLGATKGGVGKEQPLVVDMRFVSGPPDTVGRGAWMAPGSRLRWDAWATIVAWCRTVMEDQPEISGPVCDACIHLTCAAIRRRRWPANTVPSMCGYLARQFRYVVRETWAPDMMGELLDLEQRLRWMVDRPADKWYAGKCGATDEYSICEVELYASAAKGRITCPGCDTVHDVAKRRGFLLEEAKEHLVTATTAAAALLAWTDYGGSETKLVDRIRKWRDRDKLDVADVTSLSGRDRHLYRLGDIQALLVGAAQDAQKERLNAG